MLRLIPLQPSVLNLFLLIAATASVIHCGGRSIGQPMIQNSAALSNAGGKKILIVVSAHEQMGNSEKKTGYWLSEVTHFYDVVTRHGFEVDFVSPGGAPSVMDPDSNKMGDSLNKTFWENSALREKLEHPLSPGAVDAGKYSVIYFAGGHGTMWDFPAADDILQIANTIYEKGGIVSAVCHGPSGLLNIKDSRGNILIAGKKVTGFANMEENIVMKKSIVPFLLEDELKKRGAVYSKAFLPFVSHVVTDGRIVTGQNPGSAAGVGEAVIEVLSQKQK